MNRIKCHLSHTKWKIHTLSGGLTVPLLGKLSSTREILEAESKTLR